MPCYVTGSYEGDRELDARETREELLRVTRVACELAQAIRDADISHFVIFPTLNLSTQKWVREHELVDKKRRKK